MLLNKLITMVDENPVTHLYFDFDLLIYLIFSNEWIVKVKELVTINVRDLKYKIQMILQEMLCEIWIVCYLVKVLHRMSEMQKCKNLP